MEQTMLRCRLSDAKYHYTGCRVGLQNRRLLFTGSSLRPFGIDLHEIEGISFRPKRRGFEVLVCFERDFKERKLVFTLRKADKDQLLSMLQSAGLPDGRCWKPESFDNVPYCTL
ncbi:MAG: hypothetical protein ACLSAP_12260 [Oscillospiraceae bacterium]